MSLFLHPPDRFSCASNGHQRVPTEASGKWLVQPASCEAEAENNWDCPALSQQATGAWVLHLALPRGGRGKAPSLTPLSCPNTGSQAYTTTHTLILHSYTIYNCACAHTHTHTESLYLYCTILLFIWIHISTLSAFDSESKVSKTMPRWKSYTFMLQPLIEDLND